MTVTLAYLSVPYRVSTMPNGGTIILRSALFLLIFWIITAFAAQTLHGIPLPTPGQTFLRGIELFSGSLFLQHSIYTHLGYSLYRWALGSLIAVLIGSILGFVATSHIKAERIILPLSAFFQPVPSLAWIPLAILLLGLGTRSTIFIIFLAGVFPIIINVVAGIKSVPSSLLRAAAMLGASPQIIFWKVLVPGALPHTLSGLRTSLANSWRALIAAEMVGGTDLGLGYAILQCRWSLDYPSAFVAIFIIALIGLIIERGVFRKIELRTIKVWGMGNQGGDQCWS